MTSGLVQPAAEIDFRAGLRPEALAAPSSGIVEVFQYGRGRQGLIPLWVGEGDLPTPPFVIEAINRSLADGETFYGWQCGHPSLREAIAGYMAAHYGSPFETHCEAFAPNRFFATVGGMQALSIAVRLVAGGGDDVLVPTPAWPNFVGVLTTAGARPVEVPIRLQNRADGSRTWSLDLDELKAAVTPQTRALVINSPANPTGWTATAEELRQILSLARLHGLWVIADEIYGRLTYTGARAASFHDVMEADDRVIFIQTLSKNWAMTGLRAGWLEAPASLSETIENLVQYSTSGVPLPIQRGATAALEKGEDFFQAQLARMQASRDLLCADLAGSPRVRFAVPEAAFYLFCSIEGCADTRALAFQLIEEAGVGVAPGSAFGAAGNDYVRICFARDPQTMREAARRLRLWLER